MKLVSLFKIYLLPALLLLLFFSQGLYSAHQTGQTIDETYYNGIGYPALKYQDYRFLGEHPPLLAQIGALPLLFLNVRFPVDKPIMTSDGNVDISKNGSMFLYGMGNSAEKILFLERTMILLLAVFLGLMLYLFTNHLAGKVGALFALLSFSLSPNMLAHGSLYTTDMGVTAFWFAVFVFFYHFYETGKFKYVLFTGVFLGLALTSKLNSLIAIPCLFLLLILIARENKQPIREVLLNVKLQRALFYLAIFLLIFSLGQRLMFCSLGVICLFMLRLTKSVSVHPKIPAWIPKVIWIGLWVVAAVYAVRLFYKMDVKYALCIFLFVVSAFIGSLILTSKHLSDFQNRLILNTLSIFMISSIVIILSYTDFLPKLIRLNPFSHFLHNVNLSLTHTQNEHINCVEGSFITCDWRYFITSLLAKTPLVTLVTFFIGVFFYLFSSAETNLKKIIILLPPLVFLAIASFGSKINIGIRHILPIYPTIFVMAGFCFSKLCHHSKKISVKLTLVVVFILFVIHAFVMVKNFGYYISYFNVLLGGHENGAKWANDSNLNWGQDNRRLAEWVTTHKIPSIKITSLASNGAEYDYYKINWAFMTENDFVHPASGFYAIDVGQAFYLKENSYFYQRVPDFKVGKTFYVYEVSDV